MKQRTGSKRLTSGASDIKIKKKLESAYSRRLFFNYLNLFIVVVVCLAALRSLLKFSLPYPFENIIKERVDIQATKTFRNFNLHDIFENSAKKNFENKNSITSKQCFESIKGELTKKIIYWNNKLLIGRELPFEYKRWYLAHTNLLKDEVEPHLIHPDLPFTAIDSSWSHAQKLACAHSSLPIVFKAALVVSHYHGAADSFRQEQLLFISSIFITGSYLLLSASLSFLLTKYIPNHYLIKIRNKISPPIYSFGTLITVAMVIYNFMVRIFPHSNFKVQYDRLSSWKGSETPMFVIFLLASLISHTIEHLRIRKQHRNIDHMQSALKALIQRFTMCEVDHTINQNNSFDEFSSYCEVITAKIEDVVILKELFDYLSDIYPQEKLLVCDLKNKKMHIPYYLVQAILNESASICTAIKTIQLEIKTNEHLKKIKHKIDLIGESEEKLSEEDPKYLLILAVNNSPVTNMLSLLKEALPSKHTVTHIGENRHQEQIIEISHANEINAGSLKRVATIIMQASKNQSRHFEIDSPESTKHTTKPIRSSRTKNREIKSNTEHWPVTHRENSPSVNTSDLMPMGAPDGSTLMDTPFWLLSSSEKKPAVIYPLTMKQKKTLGYQAAQGLEKAIGIHPRMVGPFGQTGFKRVDVTEAKKRGLSRQGFFGPKKPVIKFKIKHKVLGKIRIYYKTEEQPDHIAHVPVAVLRKH